MLVYLISLCCCLNSAAAEARRLKASGAVIQSLEQQQHLLDLTSTPHDSAESELVTMLSVLCSLHRAPVHVVEYSSPCSPHQSATVAPGGVLVLPQQQSETGFLQGDSNSALLRGRLSAATRPPPVAVAVRAVG